MLRNTKKLNNYNVKTQFFKKNFFSSSIEKKISENPSHYYNQFKQRLVTDGMLAPFPEFAEPVQFLEKALTKSRIISLCEKNTTLNYQKHMLENRLFHLKFNFIIDGKDYPHVPPSQDLKSEEKSLRQTIQVLYFELMHEFALPPDKKCFIDAFKHKPDAPSPFEHMITADFKPSELETIRMENNNLYSGYDTHKLSREVAIRYFFDKGTNFLNSAYNKSINGFYDTYLQRYMSLPPLVERTPKLFQKAARHILTRLEANDLMTDEEILALINSKSFLEVYPNNQLKKPTRI